MQTVHDRDISDGHAQQKARCKSLSDNTGHMVSCEKVAADVVAGAWRGNLHSRVGHIHPITEHSVMFAGGPPQRSTYLLDPGWIQCDSLGKD